jgi:hypothetical protein
LRLVVAPSKSRKAELVLDPFQYPADRAVEPLCGAPEEKRTEIPPIGTEGEEAC